MENETFKSENNDTSNKENVNEYYFEEDNLSYSYNIGAIYEDRQNNSVALNGAQSDTITEKNQTENERENVSTEYAEALEAVFSEKSSFQDINNQDNSQISKVNPSNLTQSSELQKGRVKLVRLQAVSNNSTPSSETSLSSSSNSNLPSEGSDSGIYSSETDNLVVKQAIVYSEVEYQLLSQGTQSREQSEYNSPQTQTSSNEESSNTGFIHKSISSILENPNSEYQRILQDVQASGLAMMRQEKLTEYSTLDINATSWTIDSGSNNESSECTSRSNSFHQTSEPSANASDYKNHSDGNSIEISQAHAMQRFITADNQVVYGYKDSHGEFHFFNPELNDREIHNEKERKRRSRVSEACAVLRRMIPGVNEKTDKATVFEQAANYLKFLRDKFGVQFDQAYCEKFYQERA